MNSINKTLYIPLYGKALVSQKGIILDDKKAEEIWFKEQFPLKRKSKSKWLAYFMGMRSAVFDEWVKTKLTSHPNSVVLHLGCGLDSRIERINPTNTLWFDVDFDDVINERKRHYTQTENYHMLSADVKNPEFVNKLPEAENVIVILEGVSMYLSNADLCNLFAKITAKYPNTCLLVDCYTPFAVKMSKLKNPVNDVGVTKVFGVENPTILTMDTGLQFTKEHSLTPNHLINQLHGFERFIFKTLYAGKTSKKLYKLYEYHSRKQ
jgi:O-methyltransferase involved in polyketide biosynthesis